MVRGAGTLNSSLSRLLHRSCSPVRGEVFVLPSCLHMQIPGTYSEHLARSIFCVVAPGDGYSGRGEDAVLHGCIPLIVSLERVRQSSHIGQRSPLMPGAPSHGCTQHMIFVNGEGV